jgi:hypothetical protein
MGWLGLGSRCEECSSLDKSCRGRDGAALPEQMTICGAGYCKRTEQTGESTSRLKPQRAGFGGHGLAQEIADLI